MTRWGSDDIQHDYEPLGDPSKKQIPRQGTRRPEERALRDRCNRPTFTKSAIVCSICRFNGEGFYVNVIHKAKNGNDAGLRNIRLLH